MQYISHYTSPIGNILLAADEAGLTGLWFEGQKYFARCLNNEHIEKEIDIFKDTKKWLDNYFAGKEPKFTVLFHFIGTDFQCEVWRILCEIPYGETTTYGEIAKQLAEKKGISRMSAQAVGGAVGHNEISVIVPCHRVVGSNGSLSGYAGGIDRKIELLKLEKMDMSRFFIPKKGTALCIVFSRLAFHHFTNVDKAFSEMVRVLKPGGKLVLIDMEATKEELRVTADEIERYHKTYAKRFARWSKNRIFTLL